MIKEYDIDGRRYRLERISLGQLQHILRLLQGVTFSEFSGEALLLALGDRLADFLACVLIPDGKTRSDVLDGLERGRAYEECQYLRAHLPWDMALEIVTDFFFVNPVRSLPALWAKLNEALTGWQAQTMTSKPTMPSSPAATSASAPASAEK